MKWILIVIGVYGCSNELDAEGVGMFITQEECVARAEMYTKARKPETYEYRCIPVTTDNKQEG